MYNNFDKCLAKAFDKSGEVLDNFWNILENPNFPFVTLASVTNGVRNFPPYNISDTKDGKVTLTMAVAGYSKSRLSVNLEGNSLIISGSELKPEEQITLRYKGISNGKFVRVFEMTPHTKVEDVTLVDGILTVVVKTENPEVKTTQFEIK